MQCVVNMRGF